MSDDIYEYIHEVLPVKINITVDPYEYRSVPIKVVKVVGATAIYVKDQPLPVEVQDE